MRPTGVCAHRCPARHSSGGGCRWSGHSAGESDRVMRAALVLTRLRVALYLHQVSFQQVSASNDRTRASTLPRRSTMAPAGGVMGSRVSESQRATSCAFDGPLDDSVAPDTEHHGRVCARLGNSPIRP
eukprot:ctg_1300.g354